MSLSTDRVCTRYGLMRFPSDDQVIGRSLRVYGEWAEHEIAIVSSYLFDGKAIVDVGANIGAHSLAFARRFPRSTVIAIEPHPLAYTFLAANVSENEIGNVQVEHCACGAETATLPVPRGMVWHGGEANLGATSLINPTPDDATNSVTLVRRLDDILPSIPIQFIKIDVEGMESAVLAGARGVIQSQMPLIYFEARTIEGVRDCGAVLDEFGYNLHWLVSNPFNRANFRREPLNIWATMEVGVLAIPQDVRRVGSLPPVTGEEQALPETAGYRDGWDGKPFPVAGFSEEVLKMNSKTDDVFQNNDADNTSSHTTSCFWGAKDRIVVQGALENLVKDQFGSKDGVFAGDNLITIGRNLSFLSDKKFMDAFRDVVSDDNYVGQGIIWRLYTFCWAAKTCLNKVGDFVECGVSTATSSKIMCRYLSFEGVSKKLYLYDLFGIDAGMDLSVYFGDRSSTDVLSEVKENFAPYSNVNVIPGFIPDSFEETAPESIAFLHVDLNNVDAEIATLEALFDRVTPGGIVLFDDYGASGYMAQKKAEDNWLGKRGYTICELPTGQGLVIK